jgi:hypothetical protein
MFSSLQETGLKSDAVFLIVNMYSIDIKALKIMSSGLKKNPRL